MKGKKNNLKTSDKFFRETKKAIFSKNPKKKLKLFLVSYETCSELEGLYKAFSKEEAKHLFKKEYQGLPKDFENKIKVQEISK